MLHRIVWWNTGIAPPINVAKGKPKPKGHRTVNEVVSILSIMNPETVDLICLAEVDQDVISSKEFCSYLNSSNYETYTFFKPDGRIKWDIAIIYNPQKIKIIDYAYIRGTASSSHKKLAIGILVEMYGQRVRLFLSHFPSSRLSESQKASMLNNIIMRALIPEDREKFTILLGDYNVEMTSSTIINQFARSRSESLMSNKLFSPLMRHAGEKYAYSNNIQVHGTYNFSGHQAFLDFALFSSAFVNTSSKLLLDDHASGIWNELLGDASSKNDHLPIYFSIKEN